jgi:hypothetical protein
VVAEKFSSPGCRGTGGPGSGPPLGSPADQVFGGVARFPLLSRVCDHGFPRPGSCSAPALRRS